MRMMTFNLRFENDTDGDNAWIHRREMVVRVINTYAPDILGTQEGKWPQLTYLRDALPAYEPVMPGRLPDPVIQCPTLFFRKSGYDVQGGRDFWLSKTPDVHMSKDWDSAFPRMLSYAVLRVAGSYRKMIAAVTHLDHLGRKARYEQAKIIAAWVGRQESPVILMGDFNDSPESEVHAVLNNSQTRLCDTWQSLGGQEGGQGFTHHGFEGIPRLSRMDWILADWRFEIKNAKIIRDCFNGRYPSDHFPYLADLEFA